MSEGHPAGVPAKMPFSFSRSKETKKQEIIPGTPAGTPLFVTPGVPRRPGRCPGEFLKFMCPLAFLLFLTGGLLAYGWKLPAYS